MENTAKRRQLPPFAVLGIIAVIAAVVLAATNILTRGPIAEHQAEELRTTLHTVLAAESYEALDIPEGHDVTGLYTAMQDGQPIGWCVTAKSAGYGGDVAVTLGVDLQGKVTSCVVGDLNFAETAGYGTRAKEPAFQDQFSGIDLMTGGEIDGLSGATISAEAVRKAVNQALVCVREVCMGQTAEGEIVRLAQ